MGRIASLKRMAVHDGPGLRTTLFMKGCPLQCKWCHNPECIPFEAETAYIEKKCLHCGACAQLCAANAMGPQGHVYDRAVCASCGRCEEACLGGAFVFYGREVTPERAAEMLLEDADFYETSGGGVTVSGGEPLMQAEFVAQTLALVKAQGVHTAVDTCGFAPRVALETVLSHADLFLYDIKAIDPAVHRACTGQDNAIILENLRYLLQTGKKVEIRVPYIPTMNDGEMPAIAAFLRAVGFDGRVRVLPYHPYAGSKYASLGKEYGMPEVAVPGREAMAAAVKWFTDAGLNAVDGGNA